MAPGDELLLGVQVARRPSKRRLNGGNPPFPRFFSPLRPGKSRLCRLSIMAGLIPDFTFTCIEPGLIRGECAIAAAARSRPRTTWRGFARGGERGFAGRG